MKNKIKYIIAVIITILLFNSTAFALTDEEIHSREALLVNLNTDEVIFHKNTVNGQVPMASLTKLMTYLIVVEEIEDLENTMITVPNEIIQDMINRGASRANLVGGYTYSALDLLYGAMLPSGCDAAQALAWYIGNGDPEVFVNKMNAKAQELGMTNTRYIDAHGIGTLDDDNFSTEEDIYKLVKQVYRATRFKEIISTEYYTIVGIKDDKTEESFVRNTNYLMGEYSGGKYYNPYSIGGKTGSLSVSGKCLVTIFRKGNNEYVAITLGVPGEWKSTYDYHLTDHNKLINYVLEEKTENITIDIGPKYRSLKIGKKLKIEPTTSKKTNIRWTSSDTSVATVDKNGIVTGVSQGQAKITAETSTGNVDYSFVSVGLYNGVHIKYSYGPPNDSDGWDPVDFSILKNKGFDYVVIRAGIGSDKTDNTFYKNFESAIENNMNIAIWVESYANDIDTAKNEANNIVSILNNVSDKRDKINLPIFYNMYNSKQKDPEILVNIALAFNEILKENGYDVMLELGRTKLSTMDLDKLKNEGIDLSIIYRSIPPRFNITMDANGTDGDVWNYKNDAYLGKEINNSGVFSVMYMSYRELDTIHEEYVEEEKKDNNDNKDNKKEEEKKENKKTNNVTVNNNTNNNNSYEDDIELVDPVLISGDTEDDVKDTPKEEPKKDNKEEVIRSNKNIKKDSDNSVLPILLIPVIAIASFIIFIVVKKKKSTDY